MQNDLLKEVGNRIRLLRNSKAFTQENMAELLNMTTAGYAKIERGESDINLTRIQQISEVFQIPASDILKMAETGNLFVNCNNSGNGALLNHNSTVHINGNENNSETFKEIISDIRDQLITIYDRINKLERRKGV
jgi:transcriptional regulator with XRE-family HTH domain